MNIDRHIAPAQLRDALDHFLAIYCRKYQVPVKQISPVALQKMEKYHWPGNVRELQNATERALILAQKGLLQFDLLQADALAPPPPPPPRVNGAETPVLTELEWRQRERDNMQAALKIAANRSISPALRAQQMAALNVGDPVTFADKLSAYIESAKMAPGN